MDYDAVGLDFDDALVYPREHSISDMPSAPDNIVSSGEDILSRIRFLTAEESLTRLEPLVDAVRNCRVAHDAGKWVSSLMKPAFLLLLEAHAKAVSYLKDSPAPSLVPWDERTGFPSVSALFGDAGWWRKQSEGTEKILLSSCGDWAVWKRETLQCACGRLRSRLRPLELDIMIRHDLSTKDDGMVLRVSGGVKSSDKAFRHHFGKEWAYRVNDTLIGIPLDACLLRIRKKAVSGTIEVEIRKFSEEKIGEEFNREALYRMLSDALGGWDRPVRGGGVAA
ncbi:MAG: hypothetical protein Q7R73_03330 [bacterium]|nr:hypothetical protein [bacterium]